MKWKAMSFPLRAVFFANALLQPFAEFLAEKNTSTTEASPPLCPFCGAKPQFAVLRPEGDGAKRFVLFFPCAAQNGFFAGLLCHKYAEEE